ncbi:enzymatic polyprotein [Labeo rohita]|uniref:Enzymatic polyprotein n=1 Tax=Labeo rohita TaxID=84645 RepID=A0ABQ8M9R1_LABRO|nr:enzymatic polyprotein [Labeo rohita]
MTVKNKVQAQILSEEIATLLKKKAAVKVVPLGLLRAPLQWWIDKFQLHPKLHRRVRLKVTQKCIQAMHPWLSKKKLGQGFPLGNIPARRLVVTTDASLTGWGAVWQGRTVRGSWVFPLTMQHINVLELRAVYLALKRLIHFLQGKHVLVRTDNMSTVYHINHQGGNRRPGGFGSGCTPTSRMAGRVVIRFSAPAIDSSCAQACGNGASKDSIDCTEMANETLIPTSFTSSTRPSLAITNQSRTSYPGGGSDLAPKSSHPTLDLASAQSVSHELEEAVAKTINNAKAPSTWENYSNRWRVFSKWCQDRNLNPADCGLESILCFLQSLLDSGRKVNTVKVYVAAISHVHNTVEGLSIGKHTLVSQFLKGA